MKMNAILANSVAQRAFVLLSSVGVWFFSVTIFKPWVVGFYSDAITRLESGPRLFMNHAFVFSTPTAVVCLGWFLILKRLGLVDSISMTMSPQLFLRSMYWAIGIVVLTLVSAPLLGLEYGFHFSPWSLAGNFISNLSEEIIFRGFLLFAFWRAFGFKAVAVILSGIVFGLTHEQYPVLIKVYIMGIGTLLSHLTSLEGNLLPAVIVHDVSDWILDLFL